MGGAERARVTTEWAGTAADGPGRAAAPRQPKVDQESAPGGAQPWDTPWDTLWETPWEMPWQKPGQPGLRPPDLQPPPDHLQPPPDLQQPPPELQLPGLQPPPGLHPGLHPLGLHPLVQPGLQPSLLSAPHDTVDLQPALQQTRQPPEFGTRSMGPVPSFPSSGSGIGGANDDPTPRGDTRILGGNDSSSQSTTQGAPPMVFTSPFTLQNPEGHTVAAAPSTSRRNGHSAAERRTLGRYSSTASNSSDSSSSDRPKPRRRANSKNSLRITNVPIARSVASIRSHFAQFGQITSIEFTYSRKSLGCAIIRYKDAAMCNRAKQAIHQSAKAAAPMQASSSQNQQPGSKPAAVRSSASDVQTGPGAGNDPSAQASNSRQTGAADSGKRRTSARVRKPSARVREQASAGRAPDTADCTLGPADGGGDSDGAAHGSGGSKGSLLGPTASQPLLTGMAAMSAMAKLAPQVLQRSVV